MVIVHSYANVYQRVKFETNDSPSERAKPPFALGMFHIAFVSRYGARVRKRPSGRLSRAQRYSKSSKTLLGKPCAKHHEAWKTGVYVVDPLNLTWNAKDVVLRMYFIPCESWMSW